MPTLIGGSSSGWDIWWSVPCMMTGMVIGAVLFGAGMCR